MAEGLDPKIVISAQDKFSAVFGKAGSGLEQLQQTAQSLVGSFASVTAAAGGFVAAIAASSLAKFVTDGIDAVGALADLADKTTLTVETLSQLQQVARNTGKDFDTVANGAARYARSVAEARAGNQDLLDAFKAIGVSAEDLRNKSFDELFVTLAKSVAGASNATDALAVSQKLAGRGAAELADFFKDVADKGLGIPKVLTEQAVAADKLQDNVRRLTVEFLNFRDTVATVVVPALASLLEKLNILSRISLREAFSLALQGVNIENVDGRLADLNGKLAVLRQSLDEAGQSSGRQSARTSASIRRQIAEFERERDALERLRGARNAVLDQPAEGPKRDVALPPEVKDTKKSTGMTVEDLAAAAALARINLEDRRNAEFEAAANKEIVDASERILRAQVAQNSLEREQEAAGERRAADLKREADAIRDLLDPTRKYQREWERLNELVAEGALTAEEAARRSNQVFGEYYDSINRGNKDLDKTKSLADDLGLTFQSAFENAVVGGNSFRDVLKGIEQDIARIIIRKSITEPLGDAASKGIKGILGSIGSIFGGGSNGGVFSGGDILDIPSFDVGTNYVPRTGLALVHQGEKIIPAAQNNGSSGGTTVNNFNIVANDARSFAQMLATPEGRRTIMGVVNTSYNRVGRNSGAGAA